MHILNCPTTHRICDVRCLVVFHVVWYTLHIRIFLGSRESERTVMSSSEYVCVVINNILWMAIGTTCWIS